MKIHTYSASEGDTPAAWRWVARITTPQNTGKGGKVVEDFLPVVFTGPDRDTVTANAQAFWDDELRKVAEKAALAERRKAIMAGAREAKKVVASGGQPFREPPPPAVAEDEIDEVV